MAWKIVGQVGPHSEPGVDGRGWLWELRRGVGPDLDSRRVFVEISGSALAATAGNASDTQRAIETEGLSEVERAANMDEPPLVIKCASYGCRSMTRPT